MEKPSQVSFSEVKPRRIFEEVCEQIRGQIASGRLKPGDKLPPERDLAIQFGVSRPAVREALRGLEYAGLLRLQKGTKGGAFILEGESSLVSSFEDMVLLGRVSVGDLTEARMVIQDAVVRLACERATEADFAALEADIERTHRALEDGSLQQNRDAVLPFYGLLAKATGNAALVVLMDALGRMIQHVILRLGKRLSFNILEVRREFLEHLKRRDVENATRVLRDYLQSLHDFLAEHETAARARTARTAQGRVASSR